MSAKAPLFQPHNAATYTPPPKSPTFDPLELLTRFEIHESDHKHNFVSVEATQAGLYICKICHIWLHVKHNPNLTKGCSEHLGHHYHQKPTNEYKCCKCSYSISAETMKSAVPMNILKGLEAERNKPDLIASAYSSVLFYIEHLLNGGKRNIHSENPFFVSRIGLSKESQAMLKEIGYIFDGKIFHVPTMQISIPGHSCLRRIQQEIIVSLDAFQQDNTQVKIADIWKILGVVPSLEKYIPRTGLDCQKELPELSTIVDKDNALGDLNTTADHLSKRTVFGTLNGSKRGRDQNGTNGRKRSVSNKENNGAEITQAQTVCDAKKVKVPAQTIKPQHSVPPGLQNYGITCYFNCVAQYYYTLLPIRNAVLGNKAIFNNDSTKLDPHNRAKKFFELLQKLFLDLQRADKHVITPVLEMIRLPLLTLNEVDNGTVKVSNQEDVCESMDSVRNLVQTALQLLQNTKSEKQTDDVFEQALGLKLNEIIYRGGRAALEDINNGTERLDYSVMITPECENLSEGLEKYFFEQLEMPDGSIATKRTIIKTMPPILQIQIKRTQFNRKTKTNYKSNVYIPFEKTIRLDKYSEGLVDQVYNLHAVVIHAGIANTGHYYVYIFDHKGNQWWEYNDGRVNKVPETEIFKDTTDSEANPIFLAYVKATKIDKYVETNIA